MPDRTNTDAFRKVMVSLTALASIVDDATAARIADMMAELQQAVRDSR